MKKSAGLLLFRRRGGRIEVLLVHPGGPYWARKDAGAWSIPKGEPEQGEDPLTGAQREVREELGAVVSGTFLPLAPRRQPGGKTVYAWAVEAEFEPSTLSSNTFSIEWPPRSGREQAFPEVDRAEWFSLDDARSKILAGQAGFLDELVLKLADE
jgi:predicted NUDIX family NTP pyrophosphohydrolase